MNIIEQFRKYRKGGITKFQNPAGVIKPNPNLDDVLKETWSNENPNNEGLLIDGSWKPYYDKIRKLWLIGPGFDYALNKHPEFKSGATKLEIDDAVKAYHEHSLKLINDVYLPKYTNRSDTISPQIKSGLLDLRYLTGNLIGWDKLGKAISEGNLEAILKEGRVLNATRRNKLRDKNNWHYGK